MSAPARPSSFGGPRLGDGQPRFIPTTGEFTGATQPQPSAWELEPPPAVFRPTCLTLATVGGCPLACTYCWAKDSGSPCRWPNETAVRAATRLVARSCRDQTQPFTAGLHGGGEPLADVERARRILGWVRAEAEAVGIVPRFGVTTCGVLDRDALRWVGQTFASVTVSLDGPAPIHDRHRRDRLGRPTWRRVDGSLCWLNDHARPQHLKVRMTVTRDGHATLTDNVCWVADRYRPDEIIVQPVFLGRDPAPNGESFARRLAAARRRLAGSGVTIVLPDSRPDERHGPFCPPLQANLLLTPEGHAAWCFADLSGDAPIVGTVEPISGRFVVDQRRFRRLAARVWALATGCRACPSSQHCSRGCPDVCALTARPNPRICELVRCDLRERLHDVVTRSMKMSENPVAWVRDGRRVVLVGGNGRRAAVLTTAAAAAWEWWADSNDFAAAVSRAAACWNEPAESVAAAVGDALAQVGGGRRSERLIRE